MLIAFGAVTTAVAATTAAPHAVRSADAGKALDDTAPGDVTWGH
ncbi:hypothetical protein AB0D08_18780 [Kitasatospora sp. NPDC048540]|nr:hypothetical protein [Kitasatospora sp. MBT63]